MRIATSGPEWAHAGCNLLIAWVILIPLSQSIVSALVGMVIKVPAVTTLSYPQLFLLATIGGASIGLGQWLVLWVWHFRAASWIAVTAVCWAIGAGVAMALGPLFRFVPILPLGVFWLCPGTTASVGQYFLLRRSVRRAALWIPANAGAWLCGSALVSASNYGIFADLATTAVWAIIGTALMWLLQHPLPSQIGEETPSITPDVAS